MGWQGEGLHSLHNKPCCSALVLWCPRQHHMQVSQTVAASLAPRTPGPLLSKANGFFLSKIPSLKEPVEFNVFVLFFFFFLEETEFHPAFRKHLLSPTSQVLLPLSGQWLGKPKPFWLTGQAFVLIPLIRLWGAVSLKSLLGCTHRCNIKDRAGSDHQVKPNLP